MPTGDHSPTVTTMISDRVIRLEMRTETMSDDLGRLTASHERIEAALQASRDRTDTALRGMADRMGDIVSNANVALQKQGDAFLARIDGMTIQFTTEIGKLVDRGNDQDRSIDVRLEKYAPKSEVETLKGIILGAAGVLAMYAFHRITGGG
jgi:hypothetical protein